MKRKLAILTTTIFVFFSLAGMSQAQGISIKLFGGYGTMTTGDFNTFGESMDKYTDDAVAFLGLTKEGEFKKLNMGLEYGGEIIVKLPGGLGIGVGAGYIQRSNESEINLEEPLIGSMSFTLEPDFTVIPLTCSLYYFLPSPPLVNIYVNGGAGYYFGTVKHTFGLDLQIIGLPPEQSQTVGDVKSQGIGFHGGIGLEFNMGSNIGLFVEGKGRYCKLKSWEGDETSTGTLGSGTESGTMWFLDQYDGATGQWYSVIMLSEDQPSGPDVQNVREFEVDLSGFSIRAGIRIKF